MPRRLPWVLLLAVAPLFPLSAQGLRVPYDSLTLANGLQVLVAPDHAVPVVTVNIWYHVGSGDEKPGRTGFAHLFEHIMFMGSQHVPTGEFDKLLEAVGGDNNGSTTEDRTNYFEDTAAARALAQKCFGDIPRGPAVTRTPPPAFALDSNRVATIEDRVQVPRVYNAWHTVKAFAPDDAALDIVATILAMGRASRLYKVLVYEKQIASNVVAFQDGSRIDGKFELFSTARPGHSLPELQRVIDDQIRLLGDSGPTARELERAHNSIEADFLNAMERMGSFGGKADRLNFYNYYVGTPDYFQPDLDRYRRVTAADVQRVARTYLRDAHRVVLSVVPQGKPELAVKEAP